LEVQIEANPMQFLRVGMPTGQNDISELVIWEFDFPDTGFYLHTAHASVVTRGERERKAEPEAIVLNVHPGHDL
jgi:hypothetical protein